MQIANCHVRLAGDITNEVFKACVTAAEVIVLRHIHGPDSVVKFEPVKQDKRPHAGELDRLKQTYGDKVVSTVFPGSMPQLPVNFRDIGIDILAEDDKPARGRRKATVEAGDVADEGSDDNQE